MFEPQQTTVIVTCWKRFQNLDRILRSWLDQDCGELILWDNSESHAGIEIAKSIPDNRLWTIASSINYGSSARYAVAALANQPMLMFGDDDIMPTGQLLRSLLMDHNSHRDRLVGVRGRNWVGDTYEEQLDVRSKDLTSPVEVDMVVGYLMLCHRDLMLGYNFSRHAQYCCDLEMFGRIRRAGINENNAVSLQLLVSPCTSFRQLPEGEDNETALYLQPHAEIEKRSVWKQYYKHKPTRRTRVH